MIGLFVTVVIVLIVKNKKRKPSGEGGFIGGELDDSVKDSLE